MSTFGFTILPAYENEKTSEGALLRVCHVDRKLINYFPERQYEDVIYVIIDGENLNTARRVSQMVIGINEYSGGDCPANPHFIIHSSAFDIRYSLEFRTSTSEYRIMKFVSSG
jgi:hypothetical protein